MEMPDVKLDLKSFEDGFQLRYTGNVQIGPTYVIALNCETYNGIVSTIEEELTKRVGPLTSAEVYAIDDAVYGEQTTVDWTGKIDETPL